jgi:F0F1-type ATP synthase membrane subunit c/vacuolar-type H+-ATPase subunit K
VERLVVGHAAAMAGKLLVPRILWLALLLSTLVYLYVLDVTAVRGEPSWEQLWAGLAITAMATGAASLFAPRLLVKRHPANPNDGPAENRYVTGLVLAMALAEAVAIYGLVLGFQGAPFSVVLPFFAGAWFLMLIRFPTEAKLASFE